MITMGTIVLISVAIGTVAWAIFVMKNASLRRKEWVWLHQIVAIFVSVSLGFSLYFLQQGLSDLNKKQTLKGALIQELVLIEQQLKDVAIISENCALTESGGIIVNPYLMPDTALRAATSSMLFEAHFFNHFIRLQQSVDDHNRWAAFGFEIMKDPLNPNNLNRVKAQQQWQNIDTDIKLKATFLKECLLYGTSPTAGDTDCI